MKAIKKFEGYLLKYDSIVHDWLIPVNEKIKLRNSVTSSLQKVLLDQQIPYVDYIIKELLCLCDDNCTGNPCNLPFTSRFSIYYSNFKNKILFLDWLLSYIPPEEDYSDAVISLGIKLIQTHNSSNESSFVGLTGDLLEFVYPFANTNPNVLNFIEFIIINIDETWYLKNIGMWIKSILLKMNSPEAVSLAKKYRNHPIINLGENLQEAVSILNEKLSLI